MLHISAIRSREGKGGNRPLLPLLNLMLMLRPFLPHHGLIEVREGRPGP